MSEQDARIAKLPAWAQQIIQRQQQTINGLRKELGGLMRVANDDDEIQYESWHYLDTSLPTSLALPNGRFKFNLGTDQYKRQHQVSVVVENDCRRRKCLRISAMHGPLEILPVASNTLTVTSLRESD